jgi:hypothetical protein
MRNDLLPVEAPPFSKFNTRKPFLLKCYSRAGSLQLRSGMGLYCL